MPNSFIFNYKYLRDNEFFANQASN